MKVFLNDTSFDLGTRDADAINRGDIILITTVLVVDDVSPETDACKASLVNQHVSGVKTSDVLTVLMSKDA